ncbi:MAG: zinc-ribbon domain-containing protein, partial [Clostridia bacterium]|nr:zinc-ribbon domain-containing protein [Clostridia bacterium]
MICTKCGKEIEDNALTCPLCGEKFEENSVSAETTVKEEPVKEEKGLKSFSFVALATFATLMISLLSLVVGIVVLLIKLGSGMGDIFFAYLMLMIIFNGSSIFLSLDTFKVEKRLMKINRESTVGKKKTQPMSSVVIAVAVCVLALA